MKIYARREHEISAGHTVSGHEGKCVHLHGHNYVITFYCEADQLDNVGRVIDFSVIKSKLCMWLEENWDHHFLIWKHDPRAYTLQKVDPTTVITPFNPTAENIADYLLNEIGPQQLLGSGVTLSKVTIYETRKCSVEASL